MAKGKLSIVASSKAVDPTLAALFADSAGPAIARKKSLYSQRQPDTTNPDTEEEEEATEDPSDDDQDLVNSDSDSNSESDGDRVEQDDHSDQSVGSTSTVDEAPVRKRKRRGDGDDLEARYFEKLTRSEVPKPAEKKRKGDNGQPAPADDDPTSKKDEETQLDDEDSIPVHEAIAQTSEAVDLTKDEASRTVYLANITTEVLDSKSAKKTFVAHLSSVLDPDASPAQRLEKMRFRSLPVSSTKIPKRAAFITGALLSSTTKAVQAYAIYSTQAAARTATKKLNGTIVLQRHLRADLNAHPDEIDHRRCVYIGNLNFVDDETTINANSEGRKKPGVPADIEEGLWRTFMSKAGPVEFVRVPRDPNTRVGKGFAYVQFKTGMSVEKALLLNGQKFPPMLPRPIRVTRCKDPRRTTRALEKTKAKAFVSAAHNGVKSIRHRPKETPEYKSDMGRAAKLLGKGGAVMVRHGSKPSRNVDGGAPSDTAGENTIKTPEQVVYEGRRASQKDGRPAGMKFGKGKGKGKGRPPAGKPKNRSTRRATEWKKTTGGQK